MPTNTKYEAIALAAIINYQPARDQAFSSISTDDFTEKKYQFVYQTLCDMERKELDISTHTLILHLTDIGLIEDAGGVTGVAAIGFEYFSGVDYQFYFDKIINLNKLRKGVWIGKELMTSCADEGNDATEIFKDITNKIFKIFSTHKIKTETVQSIKDNFHESMSLQEYEDFRLERKSRGLPPYTGVQSGFPRLDRMLGYFQLGKLYYCGARTSMGKTTFMLNLVKNMLRMTDHKIGIMSLEMKAQDIFVRLGCIFSHVNYNRYEDLNILGEELDRLRATFEQFNKYDDRLFIESPSGISISQLEARVKRLKDIYGIDILFIDYLTRINGGKEFKSKHLEVDYISKRLQDLARELNIPLFVLAQFSRASANKEDKTPSLVDFRESGSIEEDADACLLIHRPDYYNAQNKPGEIQVIIAKNRLRGLLGVVPFACNKRESEAFTELPEIQDELRKINMTKEEHDESFRSFGKF
jgi:replicative DNA helicase